MVGPTDWICTIPFSPQRMRASRNLESVFGSATRRAARLRHRVGRSPGPIVSGRSTQRCMTTLCAISAAIGSIRMWSRYGASDAVCARSSRARSKRIELEPSIVTMVVSGLMRVSGQVLDAADGGSSERAALTMIVRRRSTTDISSELVRNTSGATVESTWAKRASAVTDWTRWVAPVGIRTCQPFGVGRIRMPRTRDSRSAALAMRVAERLPASHGHDQSLTE